MCFPRCILGDESGGGTGLVLPVGLELTDTTVVPSEAVDAALDENQSKLAILIFPVGAQVLSNSHSLLHQLVKIFGDCRGQTIGLENTKDLVSSHSLHLSDPLAITKNHTNLRGSKTLLSVLTDTVLDISGSLLHPGSRGALVRQGTLRDTLSRCVHASHLFNIRGNNVLMRANEIGWRQTKGSNDQMSTSGEMGEIGEEGRS